MVAEIHDVDFHCHLDLYHDPRKIIEECEKRKIFVVTVTTTPRAWAQNYTWTKDCNYVHAAVGLHPELVGGRYSEVKLFEELVGESRLIGEIGLDGSAKYKDTYTKQLKVFTRILDVVQHLNERRVLSIHSKQAAYDVINTIGERTSRGNVLCILHWFTGTVAMAQRAAELGCFFSINIEMLKSKNGKVLVGKLPENRIVLETDSPFTKIRGRDAVPWDIYMTLKELAKLRQVPLKDFQKIIEKNSQWILNFAGILK